MSTPENLTQSSPIPLEKKSRVKTALTLLFAGALLGLGLVSIYMPRVIAWYAEPPMPMGVTCTSSIRWALEKMQMAQAYSVAVGGVLGLLIGIKIASKK